LTTSYPKLANLQPVNLALVAPSSEAIHYKDEDLVNTPVFLKVNSEGANSLEYRSISETIHHSWTWYVLV